MDDPADGRPTPGVALPERWVEAYLGRAPSLTWLLVVNGVAFLAGVRFYAGTLPAVPTLLWPLYGDSPTALALATLSLATLLPTLGRPVGEAPVNRPLAYLHTLTFVWLVKYGLWTLVALNLRPGLYVGFDWTAVQVYWGILLTHAGFVVEALALPHFARTTRGALALALVLALAGDAFDYLLGYHPPLRYDPGALLAGVTVALSVGSVAAAALALERLPPGAERR